MAPHSSTLAWRIPWTEEPGGLQSMGSQRVRHDWATSLSRTGEGNGNPLQCSCLESPRDGAAWWAAVYGVAQTWTRLKWLSSLAVNDRPIAVKILWTVILPLNAHVHQKHLLTIKFMSSIKPNPMPYNINLCTVYVLHWSLILIKCLCSYSSHFK